MSLLLDALKRAEQEKLARQGEPGVPAAPVLSVVSSATPAPNLELQPIGAAPAPGVAPRTEAQAAQALFDAKSPGRAPESNKKGALLAALGAIGVIVIAAGAYVWYSIQSLAPRQPASIGDGRLRPPPAPTPPPAAGATPPAGIPNSPVAASQASPAPAVASLQKVAPAPAAMRSETPAPPPSPVRELVRESAAQLAPETVRLARTTETRTQVPADVAQGYASLRDGDLAAARRGYSAAVATDPVNVDARLGLATVEARAGNRAAAETQYRRVLDLDSRNATALAGLAALADPRRADGIESQLRADLTRNPDSAALHLSLGNLLAAQRRWGEAQAEFYDAHRLQPANPDALFNLAVTLDQMGQQRLAAEHYRRALDAARDRASQFDPALASRRLGELER